MMMITYLNERARSLVVSANAASSHVQPSVELSCSDSSTLSRNSRCNQDILGKSLHSSDKLELSCRTYDVLVRVYMHAMQSRARMGEVGTLRCLSRQALHP